MRELLLARANDDAPALLFEDQRWTWRAYFQGCCERAEALLAWRRPGPFHVGVLLENVPEYLFLTGAASLAGATVVGACAVVDRSGGQPNLDVPFEALLPMALPTYAPEACPMCQAGSPVVKPGSRDR